MTVSLSLDELEARLPELEWQMSSFGHTISTKILPKGLFRLPETASATAFINDIKTDLKRLANHQNEQSGFYLAQKIQQKINVLIALCRLEVNPAPRQSNYLSMITTRQHYVEELGKEKELLLQQRQALINRLEQTNDLGTRLNLNAEVGEIEKRLTLVQETMVRVTKW
ncbi:hypothetical protein [Legionella jamestowniensis]|uniref:Coiled-coil protein n=1 Tax=Legionella jamestowniensis TaxID=455 RepID=A0A0W0UHW8_9GAMM|nr:hypothetical protein [Legionella jamestowniensis]KTD07448.1 coiled-coil protein [Legionella jamestowniensis]OCH97770.1 hypothetical protein A8135_02735 [Legionella jamestowniensis]SFM00256.1 hypothetical protein SAMN02746073_2971 [Legionella jamestowniensis DSM 19215]